MSACGYEFYLRVFNSISRYWTLEDKIRIHARACNILYIVNLIIFVYSDLELTVCQLSTFAAEKKWRSRAKTRLSLCRIANVKYTKVQNWPLPVYMAEGMKKPSWEQQLRGTKRRIENKQLKNIIFRRIKKRWDKLMYLHVKRLLSWNSKPSGGRNLFSWFSGREIWS